MARKLKDDDEKPDAPEPTPPPADDPDAAVRRGGPGDAPADAPAEDAAETPPDQPSRARVKIGKKDFEVDPEMASALEERERDYMRGIQMDRREREELDRFRRASQPTQPESAEYDYDVKIFERPKEALAQFKRELTSELEAKYRAEQSTDRMWTKFYKDNPDLDGEQVLVSAKFQNIFNEIADLPTGKAMDTLADEVRRDILRISRKARAGGTPSVPPTGRAIVEGATGDRPPQPARPSPDDEPKSLSDEIRARNRRRREAKSA